MAEHEMGVGDIQRDFVESLMLYKGKPIKFLGIEQDYTANILFLYSQRKSSVKFSLQDFRPIQGRIGLVNLSGGVVYLARTPKRVMTFGIRRTNSVERILFNGRTNEFFRSYEEFQSLTSKSIASSLMGKYPPIDKALIIAKEHDGACAFDKQFFLRSDGNVYFKTGDKIGKIDTKKVGLTKLDIDIIKKDVCYEYLLGVVNEKHIKPFEKTSCKG